MTNMIYNATKGIAAIFFGAILLFGGVIYECGAASPATAAFTEDVPATNGETTADTESKDIKLPSAALGDDRTVYAGGAPFGVKLYTDGLMIIGFTDVDCDEGSAAPAKDAGMKVSDIIIRADGKKINTAEDFIDIIENSGGKPVRLDYMRGENKMSCEVTPAISKTDGKYKTGMWLRDSTAGIGTITFVIPESGVFAGLGHGICDSETGTLVPLSHGITSGVTINGIKKGVPGTPGELKGSFDGEKTGNLVGNTENGVFGIFSRDDLCGRLKVTLGKKEDLCECDAYILCTLDDNKTEKYTVHISDVHPESQGNKNFVVTITDKALIEKTGGIVQGMSGSPIIKDGVLIGAVTHVLINDPTKGYGIFADNMLANMPGSLA